MFLWTGLFFTLLLITVGIMSVRVTDSVRRQRMRVLPVAFLMLLVAILVRAPLVMSLVIPSTRAPFSISSSPGFAQRRPS